ncbi:MAG: hypothetical protein NC548_05610 [Lachnospiraceae bacterium]|nr:hypothetical protein [Lachnospiraceae bacterium]
MVDNRPLEAIENAFTDFLEKKINVATLEKTLGVALGMMQFDTQKTFHVTISKSKDGRHFFGMECYPSQDYLQEICNEVVNENTKFKDLCKSWRKINNWDVMIDALCFDRNFITFNPKELTAMLLHEVGHIILSDKPVEYFYRSYMGAKTRMKMADRATIKTLYVLLQVPLAIACAQKFWVNSANELNIEIAADKTLIATGYAEHLVTAFDKIIKACGSINTTDSQKQKNVQTSMDWCCSNISDIVRRREKLKDELYYTAIQANSGYMKALCSRILDWLGVRMQERYTGAVVESSMCMELCNGEITLEQYKPIFSIKRWAALESAINMAHSGASVEIATEGFFNKRKKRKIDMPSMYDLDRISIEIDGIENEYDRVYVLDLIYACLERVNDFEEAISSDSMELKKYESRIAQFRAELEALRQKVLAKKIVPKQYKVFVKVPDEYAG